MTLIFNHPLVRLWFYLSLSIAVLFSLTIIHWVCYALLFILLTFYEHVPFERIIRSLRGFFYFIPIMVAFYFIISLIMSQSSFIQIGTEIGTAIMKFVLVMAVMNLYSMGSQSDSVFHALRSIWVSFNKPWKRVEDWFLYMEMTMRFYPTFQREWTRLQTIHKALGIHNEMGKIQQWKETAQQLPGMVMIQLQKADDVADAMRMRGYGNQIPRGVAGPIPFSLIHFIIMITISLSFILIQSIAQI